MDVNSIPAVDQFQPFPPRWLKWFDGHHERQTVQSWVERWWSCVMALKLLLLLFLKLLLFPFTRRLTITGVANPSSNNLGFLSDPALLWSERFIFLWAVSHLSHTLLHCCSSWIAPLSLFNLPPPFSPCPLLPHHSILPIAQFKIGKPATLFSCWSPQPSLTARFLLDVFIPSVQRVASCLALNLHASHLFLPPTQLLVEKHKDDEDKCICGRRAG